MGAVVPVVYVRRKPSRARTGKLADIDLSDEWGGVKAFWGTGFVCIGLGLVLILGIPLTIARTEVPLNSRILVSSALSGNRQSRARSRGDVMRNIAGVGFVLTGIGVLLCFANSAGFVKFMKLRSLVRHGVGGGGVRPSGMDQQWTSRLLPRPYPGSAAAGHTAPVHRSGPEPWGPVGTVVPVVYDSRKPKRQDRQSRGNRLFRRARHGDVLLGSGVTLVIVGAVLAIFFH